MLTLFIYLKSFVIYFDFSKNPFFTNKSLFKKLFYDDNKDIVKVEASIIAWSSDKINPTKIALKRKKKDSGMEWHETSSFFNIFKCCDLEKNENTYTYLTDEAEFFSNELVNKSLEFYLSIAEESNFHKVLIDIL